MGNFFFLQFLSILQLQNIFTEKIRTADSEKLKTGRNIKENLETVESNQFLKNIMIFSKKHSPLITAGITSAAIIIFGLYEISSDNKLTEDKSVSLALIQQNADPRKTSYEESFDSLERLTNTAADLSEPDLIVWSETAFVPNIRRWGALEENYNSLTRITHKFLKYQKEKGLFLITGNDDYEIVESEDGKVSRNEYNAAVYFLILEKDLIHTEK